MGLDFPFTRGIWDATWLPMPKYATREEWLQAAIAWMRPQFEKRQHPLGKVRAAIGWPKSGNALGECWADNVSKDATREIFIVPTRDDGVDTLETLVHELCHAALDHSVGHRAPWKKLADSFHLQYGDGGCWKGANDEFKRFIAPCLALIGPMPHAAMTLAVGPGFGLGPCGGLRIKPKKKQNTRMIKCECAKCGYVARTTAKWLEQAGAPICPTDRVEMDAEEPKP